MGQGVIPDDWLGEYCRYAVCWPKSSQWLAVLRGVLTLPARGRFWDEHTGTILEAQSVIRETFDNNLDLQEVIMSCGDSEIGQALTSIAASLALQVNVGCCDRQGSGGAGTVQPPPSPINEGNPSVDPPPEGFNSWLEFQTYKCAIAWNIIGQLEADLAQMAVLNFGGISISSLASIIAVTVITPIPFDDIVAIAALLITAAAEIIITTTLSIVNDNEEDLVCALYLGTSAGSSRGAFLSKYAEFVASGVADPVSAFAVNALISYMVGSSTVNRLYEEDLTRNWAEQDCSMCIEAECPELIEYTSPEATEPGVELPVILDSWFYAPANQWVIQFKLSFQKTIAVEDISGWTDFPGQNDFIFWVNDTFSGSTVFNSNDAPIGVIAACASGVMISSTEFSATIVCVP